MYDVIKQIELWRQKIRWNYLPPDNKPSPQRAEQILNILESIKNWQLKNVQNNPQTTTPTVNKTITPAEPTPNSYKITDLTPQMVQQMLNVRWQDLWSYHFYHAPQYNHKNPWWVNPDDLYDIESILNNNPMYGGRKVAFITYAAPELYDEPQYLNAPRLESQESLEDIPSYCIMIYSTFISYNPKTGQFEKYPRGWIKMNANADYKDIKLRLHRNSQEILSAYSDKKQNTR